jgi:allantoinase
MAPTSTQSPRYAYSPIAQRPPLALPGGARVAVLLYLNIEHFPYDQPQLAYHSMSPISQQFAPDVMNHTWRDYGLRVGLWRLVELFERVGVAPTIMLHSDVCLEYPQIIEYGKAHAWEWVAHGASTVSIATGLDEAEERALIGSVLDTIEEATGDRPTGWFSSGIAESHSTPDLLAELGVEYLCDYSADDQPFPIDVEEGSLLSIPYNLQTVDVVLVHHHGMTAGQYADALIDQFDVQHAEGRTSGRIMPISLHPFVMGHGFRIKHLARALEHIVASDGVWLAQARDVNSWFRKTQPAT